MKLKNITYIEIAQEAQVSVGTLSRFFNNGYVSDDKKVRIQAAIKKFNYTPNSAAASVKKGNNFYIVIRTFASSKSQDLIVEGIISQLGKNTLVKYSPTNSAAIIDEVKWSLSLKPKGIICFAATDIDQHFVDQLSTLDPNIVLYGHKTTKLAYVALDYHKAVCELSKDVHDIDFIYDDKTDVETFVSKKALFEKYQVQVHTRRHVDPTSRHYVFFQNRKVLLSEMSHVQNHEHVIMSSHVDESLDNFHFAFVADYFFVGVCLAKVTLQKIKSKDIEVTFHKKNS